jgi:hypothetical protein
MDRSLDMQELLRIPADDVHIEGLLELPAAARGLVLFAHGSGSSRHSPRNNHVARVLHAQGSGTLLLDLLTLGEDLDYHTRFDISLLTHRLLVASAYVMQHTPASRHLSIGYFGASTGAAAAPTWPVPTNWPRCVRLPCCWSAAPTPKCWRSTAQPMPGCSARRNCP